MSNLCLSTLTPQSPITITTSEESLTLSVDDVLRWLAPNAPRHEAFRFLLICRSARINPFLGEAHLVPYKDRWSIIIDKSGWLRRAEEHPAFDGHESGIVVQRFDPKSPTKERINAPYNIDGACLPPNHVVVGGWAKVHRKDRRVPTVNTVSLVEYQADSPTWKRLTSTMLRKTALIHALRESGLCFGLGGAYDRDEMPPLVPRDDPGPVPEEVEVEYRATPMPSLDPGLAMQLFAATTTLQMSDYQIAAMLAKRGARTVAELTDSQAQDLIGKLHAKIDEANAGEMLLPDRDPAGFTVLPEDQDVADEQNEIDEDQIASEVGAKIIDELLVEIQEDRSNDEPEEGVPSTTTGFSNVVNALATDFGISEESDDSEVADVERPAAKAPVKRSKKKVATS